MKQTLENTIDSIFKNLMNNKLLFKNKECHLAKFLHKVKGAINGIKDSLFKKLGILNLILRQINEIYF